jgi:hypothetical protein
LFGNFATDAERQAMPWMRFGLDKDTYGQTVSKLNSVMANWTGDSLDADTMRSAIRGSWTPDQIRNFAMFGNAEGTGPMLESAQLSGENPWLSVGQTFTQTQEGFNQFEGHTPTDKATLGAWFRFGVSAKQLRSGPEASITAGKPLAAGSEVR